MKANLVYKHAYAAYTHELNGQTKKAVQSYTNMYKEGAKNPAQARYIMEDAHIDASNDYNRATKNSEFRTMLNTMKTSGKMFIDYIFNKDYRKSIDAFDAAYKKLYPKTHFIREAIITERNMP